MGSKQGKLDKKDEKSYLLQACEEHDGSINCMELSEDGSVLATGSDDGNIRLWSTQTPTTECIGILEGHEDYITCMIMEDNFILSSSADKTIRKWDMSKCECVLVFTGHESTVNRIFSTGDFLFSVSYDKKARCWDFDTGECVRVFTGHKGNITSILFIPSTTENGNEILDFIKENKENQTKKDLEDDTDNMYSKDLIITGSLDGTAKSWSIETGECTQTFKGHTAAITCMANDPDGKNLFTGSSDHTIRSWETFTGQLLKVFTGHQTTVLSLLACKKLLFSTSSDHTVKLWVMEFGDCSRTYKGHTHSVSSCYESEGFRKIILKFCLF